MQEELAKVAAHFDNVWFYDTMSKPLEDIFSAKQARQAITDEALKELVGDGQSEEYKEAQKLLAKLQEVQKSLGKLKSGGEYLMNPS